MGSRGRWNDQLDMFRPVEVRFEFDYNSKIVHRTEPMLSSVVYFVFFLVFTIGAGLLLSALFPALSEVKDNFVVVPVIACVLAGLASMPVATRFNQKFVLSRWEAKQVAEADKMKDMVEKAGFEVAHGSLFGHISKGYSLSLKRKSDGYVYRVSAVVPEYDGMSTFILVP